MLETEQAGVQAATSLLGALASRSVETVGAAQRGGLACGPRLQRSLPTRHKQLLLQLYKQWSWRKGGTRASGGEPVASVPGAQNHGPKETGDRWRISSAAGILES